MAAAIRISNIVYLKKPVKDYQKPFRFTVTMRWTDELGLEHGADILGCLGGIGRDGKAEWNGPMFWIGRKAAHSVHIAPGTYERVLRALDEKGYFKGRSVEELLPSATLPVKAEEEVGLPGEFDV